MHSDAKAPQKVAKRRETTQIEKEAEAKAGY